MKVEKLTNNHLDVNSLLSKDSTLPKKFKCGKAQESRQKFKKSFEAYGRKKGKTQNLPTRLRRVANPLSSTMGWSRVNI